MDFNNNGSGIFQLVDKKLAAFVVFGALSLYFIDSRLSFALQNHQIVTDIYTNSGAAFSINPGAVFLGLIRGILLFFVFISMNISYNIDRTDSMVLFMFMILIGGLSNFISCFVNGYVFDYIVLTELGDGSKVSCNISDIIITTGTIGYIIKLIRLF